jgi:hypothetical protein
MSRPTKEWWCSSVHVQMFENDAATERRGYVVANFRMERRYTDQKGDWHSSPSFFKRDLLDLAELCHSVYRELSVKERDLTEDKGEPVQKKPELDG